MQNYERTSFYNFYMVFRICWCYLCGWDYWDWDYSGVGSCDIISNWYLLLDDDAAAAGAARDILFGCAFIHYAALLKTALLLV